MELPQIYQCEQIVRKETVENVPKEVIERKFIMDFLSKIPLEKLKQLVGYIETNPDNRELWENYDLQDELLRLRHNNEIKLKARIRL